MKDKLIAIAGVILTISLVGIPAACAVYMFVHPFFCWSKTGCILP